jgi:multidrug efflux pump
MLGVTLFGIFLTPVFFNVIEWFVDTPLFASAGAHRVGPVLHYALGITTLGLIWLPALLRHGLGRRSGVPAARRGRQAPIRADKETGRQGDKSMEAMEANGQAVSVGPPEQPTNGQAGARPEKETGRQGDKVTR